MTIFVKNVGHANENCRAFFFNVTQLHWSAASFFLLIYRRDEFCNFEFFTKKNIIDSRFFFLDHYTTCNPNAFLIDLFVIMKNLQSNEGGYCLYIKLGILIN